MYHQGVCCVVYSQVGAGQLLQMMTGGSEITFERTQHGYDTGRPHLLTFKIRGVTFISSLRSRRYGAGWTQTTDLWLRRSVSLNLVTCRGSTGTQSQLQHKRPRQSDLSPCTSKMSKTVIISLGCN
jgi:hypothetical protein